MSVDVTENDLVPGAETVCVSIEGIVARVGVMSLLRGHVVLRLDHILRLLTSLLFGWLVLDSGLQILMVLGGGCSLGTRIGRHSQASVVRVSGKAFELESADEEIVLRKERKKKTERNVE